MSTDMQAQLAPSRIGQATAVEQTRAIAEVQAAIVVAQQCPRDVPGAVRAMRKSCAQPALADRAFFRFPRGKDDDGKTVYVSGPSVHLARELARTWGNVQYGIAELRRDDDFGQSEMIAFAWDVQTNARASSTFIVPHRRDTRNGPKILTDMRDIYESNANNGARRVREMIFSILPAWFTEDAKKACAETLSDGGGKPLATRVLEAVDCFGRLGISQEQLAQKIGSPSAKWTAQDVATLGVIYTSIQRGEIRKDEEFPETARVTAAEVTGNGAGQGTDKSGTAQRATGSLSGSESAKAQEPPAASPTRAGPADGTDRTAGPAPETPAQPGSRGESQRQAALARLDGILKALPLGEPEDVAALLLWLSGTDVVPGLMSISQARMTYSQLEDFLKAAGRDVEQAASDIWTRYREVTGDKPGGTDGS